MFKQFINKMADASFYLSASVVIFFIFFLLVGMYIVLMDKRFAQEMSNKPLEN
ncbi:MAG: hypothetical protein SFY32_08290 [Bacteroidota bacterium]|nr:hypothetical protein [Bacteroidota bacterium]